MKGMANLEEQQKHEREAFLLRVFLKQPVAPPHTPKSWKELPKDFIDYVIDSFIEGLKQPKGFINYGLTIRELLHARGITSPEEVTGFFSFVCRMVKIKNGNQVPQMTFLTEKAQKVHELCAKQNEGLKPSQARVLARDLGAQLDFDLSNDAITFLVYHCYCIKWPCPAHCPCGRGKQPKQRGRKANRKRKGAARGRSN